MIRSGLTKQIASLGVAAAAFVLVAGPIAGCRGERTEKPPRRFFPDMDDQQRWDPQEQTEFFVDGRTTRPAPANTVAFGPFVPPSDIEIDSDAAWAQRYAAAKDDLLAADDAVYLATSADGSWLREIPVPVTRELVELGQKKFNIYCAACHGFEGDGQGMVGRRWSYPVTNIVAGVYLNRDEDKGRDGYLWHVAREGVWDVATGANKMPGYKHAISEREAWGVVAYLRALQRSRSAGEGDLTQEERDKLVARAAPAGAGDEIASTEGTR